MACVWNQMAGSGPGSTMILLDLFDLTQVIQPLSASTTT